MARAAEEVGFDSVWLGDHLIYDQPDRGPWEVWTQMAALAAATARVTIGPLVACAGFHPPGLIAKMAATIDEISQGRFVLGLGAGWNRREFDAFGIPYDRRVSRFAEAFRIIVGMLDGERVTLDGEFHKADDVFLLPQPHRRVPILIGSNGPRMLSIAAEDSQIWNTWWDDFGNTAEGFHELQQRIPPQLERSACVLVQIEGQPVEREPTSPAVSAQRFPEALREFEQAGADEVIVVASPITERSIRTLGAMLP